MLNFWENFILTTVMGILSGLKKDPSKVPAFKTILTHILNDVSELLGVIPPVVP